MRSGEQYADHSGQTASGSCSSLTVVQKAQGLQMLPRMQQADCITGTPVGGIYENESEDESVTAAIKKMVSFKPNLSFRRIRRRRRLRNLNQKRDFSPDWTASGSK